MPKTSWTYLICVLAICGVFPFAGFFSKDAILAAALQWSMDHPAHWFLAFAGFFTALLTAYYMFRQFFMTFTGKPRDEHAFDRAHESPWQMTTPLIVLAFLALVSGWPGGKFEAMLPPSERAALIELYESRETAIASGASGIQIASLDATPFLQEPLAPAAEAEHAEEEHGHGAAHWIAMGLSILLAALGIVIAMATYWDRFTYFKIDPARWVRVFPINAIHKVLWNKYFFDEIYGFVLVGGSMVVMRAMAAFDKWIVDGIVNLTGFFGQASGFLIGIFDNWAVDGAVNGFAKLTGFAGDRLSYTTTGKIRNYLLFVTLGVVALTAVLIFMVRGAI
jgi:NADH-quinone oxidoreductase subunit L